MLLTTQAVGLLSRLFARGNCDSRSVTGAHTYMGRKRSPTATPTNVPNVTDKQKEAMELRKAGHDDSAVGHLLGISRESANRRIKNGERQQQLLIRAMAQLIDDR